LNVIESVVYRKFKDYMALGKFEVGVLEWEIAAGGLKWAVLRAFCKTLRGVEAVIRN